MIVLKEKRKGYKVRVIDQDGNFEVFDCVKDVANALEVKLQTVYQAICDKKPVRGCQILKERSETVLGCVQNVPNQNR